MSLTIMEISLSCPFCFIVLCPYSYNLKLKRGNNEVYQKDLLVGKNEENHGLS